MPADPGRSARGTFYQLAYVTTDLDAAIELLGERYGGARFGALGELSLPVEGGGHVRLRMAMCFVGPVQLEIIEPRGGQDQLYREALPVSGFGLAWHHVGFKMRSLAELERVRRELEAAGLRIALAGGSPERAVFFYVDTRPALGHYVEYLYLSPERESFHASLPRN